MLVECHLSEFSPGHLAIFLLLEYDHYIPAKLHYIGLHCSLRAETSSQLGLLKH